MHDYVRWKINRRAVMCSCRDARRHWFHWSCWTSRLHRTSRITRRCRSRRRPWSARSAWTFWIAGSSGKPRNAGSYWPARSTWSTWWHRVPGIHRYAVGTLVNLVVVSIIISQRLLSRSVTYMNVLMCMMWDLVFIFFHESFSSLHSTNLLIRCKWIVLLL